MTASHRFGPDGSVSKNIAQTPRFFIITEGSKTEPLYFEKYRGQRFFPRICREKNTRDMKEKALNIMKEEDLDFESGDMIWFVFDKDELDPTIVKDMFEWAHINKVGMAFSNPCFELWLLLHFNYSDTNYGREDAISKLKDLLKRECGMTFSKNGDYYVKLLSRREDAIRNSKQLHELRDMEGFEEIYRSSSITLVYPLVESLMSVINNEETTRCRPRR